LFVLDVLVEVYEIFCIGLLWVVWHLVILSVSRAQPIYAVSNSTYTSYRIENCSTGFSKTSFRCALSTLRIRWVIQSGTGKQLHSWRLPCFLHEMATAVQFVFGFHETGSSIFRVGTWFSIRSERFPNHLQTWRGSKGLIETCIVCIVGPKRLRTFDHVWFIFINLKETRFLVIDEWWSGCTKSLKPRDGHLPVPQGRAGTVLCSSATSWER
jgi:hypothetical protein